MPAHATPIEKPCEFCGAMVAKTLTEQSQRKYWTCNASCANKLRIKLGAVGRWGENPLRGQKETRPCAECGEPVTRYLNPLNASRPEWTCSQSCRAKRGLRMRKEAGTYVQPKKPRKGAEVPCPTCGKVSYKSKLLISRGRIYCSVPCSNIGQTKPPVIKDCAVCGKTMTLKPSQAAKTYCTKACESKVLKWPLGRMHNGREARLNNAGYVLIWEPDHPNKVQKGWQFEHRMIVEKVIGRYLLSDEAVHHKNGNKQDNSPDNLEVMPANAHAALSARDYRDGVKAMTAKLAAYEAKFGPIETD